MSDPAGKSSQKNTDDSTDDDPSFKKPSNRKRKKKVMKKTNNKKVNDNKTPEREIPHLELQNKIQNKDEIEHTETETINSKQIASTSKGRHTRQDNLEVGSQTNTYVKTNIKNYSTRMHEISCKTCGTSTECDFSKYKEERLYIKNEISVRSKALQDPNFPNKELISEYLTCKDEVSSINLKWTQPDLIYK
ncbi:hypothetical protein HHI36_007995 [Cryptolaemus montrouzieri]|uniref:Uncharacterized protein n=1 Tax=Cryptolaemus montrouzieri TaxID=559131 RepID=A0ABD2MR85_9CUCU